MPLHALACRCRSQRSQRGGLSSLHEVLPVVGVAAVLLVVALIAYPTVHAHGHLAQTSPTRATSATTSAAHPA